MYTQLLTDSQSLRYSVTQTHTHTRKLTKTHTPAHTLTHTHTRTHTHTHTHTYTNTHTHANTRTTTLTHTHNADGHTNIRARIQTHAHTHNVAAVGLLLSKFEVGKRAYQCDFFRVKQNSLLNICMRHFNLRSCVLPADHLQKAHRLVKQLYCLVVKSIVVLIFGFFLRFQLIHMYTLEQTELPTKLFDNSFGVIKTTPMNTYVYVYICS